MVLNEGSEQSFILPLASQHLTLASKPESLTLQTANQEELQLCGVSVDVQVSPLSDPMEKYRISQAFPSKTRGLCTFLPSKDSTMEVYTAP